MYNFRTTTKCVINEQAMDHSLISPASNKIMTLHYGMTLISHLECVMNHANSLYVHVVDRV